MSCPHHPDKNPVVKLVCSECGLVLSDRNYADLLNENYQLRKTMEDFCECFESMKEIMANRSSPQPK